MRAPTRLRPVSRAASVSIGTSDFARRSGNCVVASALQVREHRRPRSGSGRCSAAACGFSTTSAFRSCSPSLTSTVTMFDWRIAGSLAQPSTLTDVGGERPAELQRVAARHDELGEVDDDGDLAWVLLRRPGERLQVERAQQVAVDELERRARLAQSVCVARLAPERVLEPVAPVLAAARRAHAAAAVVAQHDVVAGEHHLVEKGRERAAARPPCRHDVEDVAVEQELRGRARAEQVAHLARPSAGSVAVARCRWRSLIGSPARGARSASGGGSVEQILHRAVDLLLVADPLRRCRRAWPRSRRCAATGARGRSRARPARE